MRVLKSIHGTNVRQNTELHRVLSPMTYPKLVSFRDLTFLYWLESFFDPQMTCDVKKKKKRPWPRPRPRPRPRVLLTPSAADAFYAYVLVRLIQYNTIQPYPQHLQHKMKKIKKVKERR